MTEAIPSQHTDPRAERRTLDALVGGVLFGAFLLIWMFVNFEAAFFITILLVWLVFRMDPRYLAGATLLLLIAIPVLLSQGMEPQAEQTAIYAFFLLSMAVILQIIEFVREGRTEPVPNDVPLPATQMSKREQVDHQRLSPTAPRRRRRISDIRRKVEGRHNEPAIRNLPELTLQERLEGVRAWRRQQGRLRPAM